MSQPELDAAPARTQPLLTGSQREGQVLECRRKVGDSSPVVANIRHSSKGVSVLVLILDFENAWCLRWGYISEATLCITPYPVAAMCCCNSL